MSAVGIVVVTYECAAVLPACLAAAVRAGQVVVVDNASTDGTPELVRTQWPSVRLIANAENRGFAAACNQGIAALDTPYILLLNPDAVLTASLEPLVAACSQTGIGAAAGMLTDGAGVPQRGFTIRRLPLASTLICEVLGLNRLWPGNPVNRRYRYLDADLTQAQRVEQPAGALLLLRRDVWQDLNSLDEGFFPLWFEEVDYCRRLADTGWEISYEPAVTAIHEGGHTVKSLPPQRRTRYWYGSLLRYAGKHFSPLRRGAVGSAVVVAAILRGVAEAVRTSRAEPLHRYGQVIVRASLSVLSRRWAVPPAATGSVDEQPGTEGKHELAPKRTTL